MWAQHLVAPYRFELVEAPSPKENELQSGEVILQMRAGAICGSDLPLFRGGIAPSRPFSDQERQVMARPGYPLHEVVGDVIASNSDLEVGRRVVGWAQQQNALSDQIVANAHSLQPLDSDNDLLPVEQTIIQPLACILHTLGRVRGISGQRAAVIGLGPIGVLYCHALHTLGASHVIGVDPVDRSDMAHNFGVDEFVNLPSDRWARTIGENDAPNIIIEAVGHQVGSLNHALDAVAVEGQIYYFGVADDAIYPVDMKKIQRKDLTLMSGTTPHQYRRGVLAKAQAYLHDQPNLAKAYFTNVFDVKDAQQAYELANRPAVGQMKVALNW